MNYLKARKTSKITCLGEASSISIFAPEGNEASHIIEKLIKKLEEKIIVTVYKNPEPSLLYTVENPIILIGNLSNSRCVETHVIILPAMSISFFPSLSISYVWIMLGTAAKK
jgi:hypothetical protein